MLSAYPTMFENHRKSLIQQFEASYVYILSGLKIKNAKNTRFWDPEDCGQTVLPDRSILIRQKSQILKIPVRHFGWFS